MLSKRAAPAGSVVDKDLHSYGDKWVAIVIVMVLHMCIGQDVGIGLRLAKEKHLTFDLGEKLAPKVHRHGGQASAEHADHVVLEHLNGLLGQIAPMVIGGDGFICHLGEFDSVLYANNAWLSSIWCHGTMPHWAIWAGARWRARISLPLLYS